MDEAVIDGEWQVPDSVCVHDTSSCPFEMTSWVYPSGVDAKTSCKRKVTLVSRDWIHNAVKVMVVKGKAVTVKVGMRVDALVMV